MAIFPNSLDSSRYSLTSIFNAYFVSPSGPKPPGVPHRWRIQNVPEEWTAEQLLENLRYHDQSLAVLTASQLSLYPAYSGKTQTALLNMEAPLGLFRGLDPDRTHPIMIIRILETGARIEVDLTVDCHFYGLTPLNHPVGDNIIDVVAVTGLGGHAYGSWRNRANGRMWLEDFLPKDFGTNIRILTYGYNSSLKIASPCSLLEYRRSFVQDLNNSRTSLQEISRPIIFIGHSFGCIVIMQALLQSQSIVDSTRAVFFFGAPHAGLNVDSLVAMVENTTVPSDTHSARLGLLEQLRENSEFLEDQKERLIPIWEGLQIVSFYEVEKTPSMTKDVAGDWARKGDPVRVVSNLSALLYVRREHRFSVNEDHTNMVKFMSRVDSTYLTVVLHMKKSVDQYLNSCCVSAARKLIG